MLATHSALPCKPASRLHQTENLLDAQEDDRDDENKGANLYHRAMSSFKSL